MTIPTDDDPPLRTVRLRIGLLVAVYLACIGAFLYAHLASAGFADWILTIMFVIAFSLPSMLSFGIVLLAPWQRTNLVLTAVVLLLFGAATYECVATEPLLVGAAALTALMIVALLPCLPLRLAGFTLRKLSPAERAQPARPLRFTITQIMALTALVAIATALLHWLWRLRQSDALSMEAQVLLIYGIYTVCFVSPPMFALWSVMSVGRIWWRVLVAAGGMATVAWFPSWYLEFDLDWSWVEVFLGPAPFIVGALLVVRSCGYRLVRRLKRKSLTEPFESLAAAQQPAATDAAP